MSDILYDGFLKIRKVQRDGKDFEVMDRGNSVNVLVVKLGKKKRFDRVLVGTQYRAGANASICTNVAGMVDDGEDTHKTAIRETLEESGFEITDTNLYYIGAYYNSPGGSSEQTAFYVAVVNGAVQGPPTDPSEGITWHWDRLAQAMSIKSMPCQMSRLLFDQFRNNIKKTMYDRGVLTAENALKG